MNNPPTQNGNGQQPRRGPPNLNTLPYDVIYEIVRAPFGKVKDIKGNIEEPLYDWEAEKERRASGAKCNICERLSDTPCDCQSLNRCGFCRKPYLECVLRVERTFHQVDYRWYTTVFRCAGVVQYEELDYRDILNMRLTCKGLSRNLRQWFKKATPRLHNGTPQQLRARLSSFPEMDSFSKFTKTKLITRHIKQFRINVAEFNSGGLANLMQHSAAAGRYGKMFLQDIRDTRIRLHENGDFSADLHEDRHLRYQQAYIEEQWMQTGGDRKKLFSEGFSRLYKLKELIIGGWSLPHWDKSGSRIGDYMLPHDETFGCATRSAAVAAVLQDLAYSHPPKALEKLVIQQNGDPSFDLSNEEAGIWAFDMPSPAFASLPASTRHLTTVHLTLSDGTFARGNNIAPGGHDAAAGAGLLRFLAAAPAIQSFSLATARDTLFPTSFIAALLAALPPRLAALHLHHLLLDTAADLSAFFFARRAWLRRVGLSRVYLVAGRERRAREPWTAVFKLMKDHLLALEEVHLEQLWELGGGGKAASNKKLHFAPAAPAGISFGHPGAGGLVEGSFVPKQRYDAVTSKGFGGMSEDWMVEDVQRALAMAIWDAGREDESGVWDVPLPERIVGYVREMFREKEEEGLEEDWASDWGYEEGSIPPRLFTQAFSRLPALKEIIIGDWSLGHHDTHGSRPSGYMLPHAETFGCSVRTAALRNLLENLAQHPKAALGKLVVQQDFPDHRSGFDLSDEEAGIWALDLPSPVLSALALSTTNLTTLHLALSDGTFIHGCGGADYCRTTTTTSIAPAASAPDAAQRALAAFISACPHVQIFSLAAAKNTFFPPPFLGALLAALPAGLTGIHLHNVLAASMDLSKFFWERRGSLRAVGLSRVYLDVVGEESRSDSWTPLFKLIKDHLLGLEEVYLEQLWELGAAESSCKKLCFAAVPDGVVGRAGTFVEGRFVPGGRYDSLTSYSGEAEPFDDGLGRDQGWEAESVQECLAKAIWGAESEEGGRVWDVPLPERIVEYLRDLAGEKDEGEFCKAGGKDCVYDTEQGETRTAALKNMNTALERNLSSAMHALRMLQTWPEDEAEHLFQCLRFAADLPAFLSTLQTPLPAEPPPHCRSQWVDIPDVLRYIRDNLDDIKHAFSIYIERTTMLFHVYTEADVSRILALVDEPSVLDIPGPVLCEVCSIVAIASHFDRQRVPPDKSDLMYSVAKHFLDDLVLQNPLRAIKVCALLVLYNVVVKATVALTYVGKFFCTSFTCTPADLSADMGLGIADNMGLYGQQRPRTVDQHSWLDAKKVWRSLVLCKGWLQATLGYLPSKPTTFVPDLCLIGTADVQDAAEFFRTEFTKISILKAKILNTAATPDLSQRTIDDIRHDLQRWYDSLPPQWGLARNLQTDTDHSPTRITTSYLHLLHLGAIMLLHRRIVSNHRRLMRTQEADDPGRAPLEANIQGSAAELLAVRDGVTAARLSARLLALIMAEGGITRHCWICIFQSYMSCCTLLYTSLHKRLMLRRRRSPPRKEEEEEEANGGSGDEDDAVLAGRALAILSHCAKLDPGALALERTLLPYSAMLLGKADGDGSADVVMREEGEGEGEEDDASAAPPLSSAPTYLLPPPGTTPAHRACTELFELLSKPFGTFAPPAEADGGDERLQAAPLLQYTMTNVDELGLGMHLDWSGGMGSGCFAEGVRGQPFGWTEVRSSVEHAEGAETLEIS
ncbi:hypothetical protein SLS55_005824 [Diplodia seriata]|uniref:Zn(2)-C6 fungal-type domain-containing protein n=1 Tax=Diplodia seriata TaxID=420778 RepID=A0ABR3CKT6_9PEZI